jgi:hypothetical protein
MCGATKHAPPRSWESAGNRCGRSAADTVYPDERNSNHLLRSAIQKESNRRGAEAQSQKKNVLKNIVSI